MLWIEERIQSALPACLRSLASLSRAVCGQDVSGFSLAGMGRGAPGRP